MILGCCTLVYILIYVLSRMVVSEIQAYVTNEQERIEELEKLLTEQKQETAYWRGLFYEMRKKYRKQSTDNQANEENSEK